ncbi:MAG: hypothetical protein WCB86_11265 [Candidatus Dormiibacterota bacterium]
MVPESYAGYFSAGASAAGALVGLLFVAVSLRSDSVFGESSRAGARALAGSTFTSLVNAFFISFMALLPGINLGYPAVVLALLSIVQTLRLHRHLGRADAHPILMTLSLAAFGGQLVEGTLLIANPHARGDLDALAYLVVASFGVALTRAWALIQGREGRQRPTAFPASAAGDREPHHT